MKDGLQPGGGAMSDGDEDSSLDGEDEPSMFAEQVSGGSGGGGGFSSGNEDGLGVRLYSYNRVIVQAANGLL